jgi:hypothetical protein
MRHPSGDQGSGTASGDPEGRHPGEPKQFHPQMAIYTCDMQEFHAIPVGMKTFEKLPGH